MHYLLQAQSVVCVALIVLSSSCREIPYPQMTQPSLSMEVEELDKELASPAAAKLPSTRPSGLFTVRRSTVRSASVVRKGGLRLELHLWKVSAGQGRCPRWSMQLAAASLHLRLGSKRLALRSGHKLA